MNFRARSLGRYATSAKKRAGIAIQDHLDTISLSQSVVLDDIERLRPQHQPAPDSPAYPKQYGDLLKRLTGAFNATQLRQFLKLYDLPLPVPGSRKEPLAVAIMQNQWHWPSLESIREQERAAEVGIQLIPLNPTQAVLILGKDGAESRAIMHQHSVRLTFQSNPLAVRVEGPNAALVEVSKHIDHLKASIVEELFALPPETSITHEILQRISRLSGALVEMFGENQVRISFLQKQTRTGMFVRRLLAQTLCEDSAPRKQSLFIHLPPSVPSSSELPASDAFPHDYALYPFLSPRFLPWTTSARGVFRVRRVEDWQGPGAVEDLTKTGGLTMARGHLLDMQQQKVKLRDLFAGTEERSGASTSIIASMGHVLLTSPPGEQFRIKPPLQGQWKIPNILNWLQSFSDPIVFAPTLPPSLLGDASSHQTLHRLVYRSVTPDHVFDIVKVEVSIPRLPNESSADAQDDWIPQCITGSMMDFDLLIPDRPTDIRFTTLRSAPLDSSGLPQQVTNYLAELRSFLRFENPDVQLPPDPPVTINHLGTTYLLQSCLNVRQKIEQGEVESIQMVTESAIDLEGEQKTAARQAVLSGGLQDEAAWKVFLRSCDSMTHY
uniref:K Homology domain-containing protein n=1 Tax=Mycena chlorophos TaxID=658473 RepID=A0ABQ0KX15_MYCCL|nr:predicted protein [Mycena chlorophos]